MDNPINKIITKNQIEKILNHFGPLGNDGTFLHINDPHLYIKAFVHESYYQAIQNYIINNVPSNLSYYIPNESNERLEFLGDHVLKTILGRYLYLRFPNKREGFLTNLKIKLEQQSSLHKMAVHLGFREFLLLSLQVENQTILDRDLGRNAPNFYEDAFEAFIGAIMIDFEEMGYIYADRFVRHIIENTIDFSELITKNDNHKNTIQKYFHSVKWNTPVYVTLKEKGVIYRKIFTRAIFLPYETLVNSGTLPHIIDAITTFTTQTKEKYKVLDEEVYLKLVDQIKAGNVLLGIGKGKKIISAEQECALTACQLLHVNNVV